MDIIDRTPDKLPEICSNMDVPVGEFAFSTAAISSLSWLMMT